MKWDIFCAVWPGCKMFPCTRCSHVLAVTSSWISSLRSSARISSSSSWFCLWLALRSSWNRHFEWALEKRVNYLFEKCKCSLYIAPTFLSFFFFFFSPSLYNPFLGTVSNFVSVMVMVNGPLTSTWTNITTSSFYRFSTLNNNWFLKSLPN